MTLNDPPEIRIFSWLWSARSEPERIAALARRCLTVGIGKTYEALLWAVIARAELEANAVQSALISATEALNSLQEPISAMHRDEVASVAAAVFCRAGQLDRALDVLMAARRTDGSMSSAVVELQWAELRYRRGDMAGSFAHETRALEQLTGFLNNGGPVTNRLTRSWYAVARWNRAVSGLYVGDITQCLVDFDGAEGIFVEQSMPILAAYVVHNRGMARARMGDIPAALGEFDRAEDELRRAGRSIDSQLVARCEVLVTAGLFEDVLALLPPVIDRLDAAHGTVEADEGRLYVAQAKLALGAADTAEYALDTARRLRETGRRGWAAIADDVAIETKLRRDGLGALSVDEATRLAADLDAAGMGTAAGRGWLRAAEVARHHGDPATLRSSLLMVTTRRATLLDRVASFEAVAMLSQVDGDLVRARRAVRRGLDLVASHRALFEATELKVQTSAWGDGLARLAIGLDWQSAPAKLLAAAERWRATALTVRSVRPPDDPQLAGLLSDVRASHGAVAAMEREGQPVALSEARLRRAEHALSRYMRSRNAVPMVGDQPFLVKDLRAALGDRLLVEVVQHDGYLAAVVLGARRTERVDLGPSANVERAAAAVSQALGRLAPLLGSPAAGLLARSARQQVEHLRHLVVEPIRPLLGRCRELVIVPPMALMAAPWPMLFGQEHVVAVAPSARRWMALGEGRSGGHGVLVAGGPGLAGADREVELVGSLYTGAATLRGPAATVAALGEQLATASVAHLACHARIRVASPLFSSLEMTDGPATAYDIERIDRLPELVVLSACSSGVTSQRTSGEVLGMATIFLGAGTTTLVASTMPLPDELAVGLAGDFHQGLIRGHSVGESLAALLARFDQDTPEGIVGSAALSCFGRSEFRYQPSVVSPGRTTG